MNLDRRYDHSTKNVDKYVYSTLDRIGKGFSSVVYKGKNQISCKNILLVETIAIKIIDSKALKDVVAKQMLENQTSILKELQHQNILTCYEIVKKNNQCFIITQFCNQGDMANLLKKKGKLSERQVLKYLKQILAGFKMIVQKNILHRDLKPANVFLNNNTCKIADFGFAKKNRQQTIISNPGVKEKYNVGSPLYMSPEALKKNIYSTKSDIWSIGIIIYQLLYTRTPWQCRSQKQLIDKMQRIPISFPSTNKISQQLKSFIKRCLEVDQSRRFTLDEMLNHSLIKKQLTQFGSNNMLSTQNISQKAATTRMALGEKQVKNMSRDKVPSQRQKTQRFSIGFPQKQNKSKNQNDISTAIQKINICRLIFKLTQQLPAQSSLLPHLREQLTKKITQLYKANFTDKVKKVINQYYTKYINSTKNKPMFQVMKFQDKALEQFGRMNQWGKQLLLGYLSYKKGLYQKISQSLDKPKKLSEVQMQRRLKLMNIR